MKKAFIVAISGTKNSGKTRLITKLIPELNRRGLNVAVVKHDGHDFTCDIPGTDTYAFTAAGAYGTGIFSSNRMFVHKTGTGENETDLIKMFPEADIILLEGFKDSVYSKIEVIRDGLSDTPVSNPEGRFLIVSDQDNLNHGEYQLGPNDTEEIAAEIMMQKEKYELAVSR